eukprot:g46285.t1
MRGSIGHGMRPGWGDFKTGTFNVKAIGLWAPEVEYEVLLLQFAYWVIVTLEEAKDGRIITGVGGGVKMLAIRSLTDVEEATLGTMDTVDQVGGCAGEPLSDMKGLLWALDGGEVRDVVDEFGVRDRILAGRWVRGGVVRVAVGVGGLEINVGVEVFTTDGDREVQEGEGDIRDGPGEFEVGVK